MSDEQDRTCDYCGAIYPSIKAALMCCQDVDERGHRRRVKGDDWLP